MTSKSAYEHSLHPKTDDNAKKEKKVQTLSACNSLSDSGINITIEDT